MAGVQSVLPALIPARMGEQAPDAAEPERLELPVHPAEFLSRGPPHGSAAAAAVFAAAVAP
jgi:hypothetical protein